MRANLTKAHQANHAKAVTRHRANTNSLLDAIASGMTIRSAASSLNIPWQVAYDALDWAASDPVMSVRLAQARKLAADALIERVAIAAEGPGDDADSMVRVGRDRLRADRYSWLARCYDPDTYGDRTQVKQESALTITVESNIPLGPPSKTHDGGKIKIIEASGGVPALGSVSPNCLDALSSPGDEADGEVPGGSTGGGSG